MNPFIKDKLQLAATVFVIAFVIIYFVGRAGRTPRSASTSASSAPIFDVPALVGKDFNGVSSALIAGGAVADPGALNNSFVPATGKVQDFFIESNEADGAQADISPLRTAGNLDALPSSCRVAPVPATSQPNEYTGITITPP